MICIGTGNEGRSAGHKAGIVRENEETVIQLAVQEQEPALNLQIWKAYYDIMDISFVSPSGERIGPIQEVLGTQRFSVGIQNFCSIMENQVHTVLHRKFMLIFYRKRYISTVAFGRLC